MKPLVKRSARLIGAVAAAMLLGACTDNSGDEAEGHLLETQQQSLERARDVEQDLAEGARRQAEQIERSEGGG